MCGAKNEHRVVHQLEEYRFYIPKVLNADYVLIKAFDPILDIPIMISKRK